MKVGAFQKFGTRARPEKDIISMEAKAQQRRQLCGSHLGHIIWPPRLMAISATPPPTPISDYTISGSQSAL